MYWLIQALLFIAACVAGYVAIVAWRNAAEKWHVVLSVVGAVVAVACLSAFVWA